MMLGKFLTLHNNQTVVNQESVAENEIMEILNNYVCDAEETVC